MEAARLPRADLRFLRSGAPWIMGVLNATPDSFYAASRSGDVSAALSRAEQMVREGANILDIGGESTRPGAASVSAEEEARRVLPLIEALQDAVDVPLSLDTQKAEVARQALARGVGLINDISALRADPAMADVVAEAGVPVILMHMQGRPETMQQAPRYGNVVSEVQAFLEERLKAATKAGIAEENILLDPGIGFGKTLEHNVTLLRGLATLRTLGRPIVVGVSRKMVIGHLASSEAAPLPAEERLEGSIAAALFAVDRGADGIRVHDVGATKRALRVWTQLKGHA